MAEPYVPALFVGREELLGRIEKWVDHPEPDHRVWSIVGPPGIGKSFLLHRARERLVSSPHRLIFWVNLSRDSAIRNGPDVLAKVDYHNWLEAAVHRAREHCPHVQEVDASQLGDAQTPEAALDALTYALCQPCDARHPPTLIVDSFEEIAPAQRLDFEERVLGRFINQSCTRILLSLRDDYALTSSALRWNECRVWLSVLDAAEGQEQIKRRVPYLNVQKKAGWTDLLPLSPDVFDQLQLAPLTVPYNWDHPGINTFLAEQAIFRFRRGTHPFLTRADVRDCIRSIALSASPLTDPHLDMLENLARQIIPFEWTAEMLWDALRLTMEDVRLSELFQRGIVLNVEGTPRYKVADGVRELLRASL